MNVQVARLAGMILGALSNVPCYLFLLLATSLGLHWWRMPWPQGITHYLLSLLVVSGLSVAIVVGAILLIGIRKYARVANQSRSRKLPSSFNLWMLVVAYPMFSAWAWSVREAHPSSLLLAAAVSILVGHLIGAMALGLKLAHEKQTAASNAT